MNQYIITEELADEIDSALWAMEYGMPNRCELMEKVRSSIYNPQAESLKELKLVRANVFPEVGTFERGLAAGLDMAIEKLELREGKDGEQIERIP